jgi:hypothetical protein
MPLPAGVEVVESGPGAPISAVWPSEESDAAQPKYFVGAPEGRLNVADEDHVPPDDV